MNIFNIVTPAAIAAYYRESARTSTKDLLGETLFPLRKKAGLDITMIKGKKKAPVTLSAAAWDSKAIEIDRGTIEKTQEEMILFKNVATINEKVRQQLLILGESNDTYAKAVVGEVFDDQMSLLEAATVTRESLCMQALTTGAITINDNGVKKSVNYGVKKVTPNVKWDVPATANPIADLNAWADEIEAETGVRPAYVVMNSVTLGLLGNVDAIKNAVYVFGQGKVNVTNAVVADFVKNQAKLEVIVYSKGRMVNGVFTKYVPDGCVALVPEVGCGYMYMGTTPAEADLMGDPSKDVQIVDTGVAIYVEKQTDPVNVRTFAAEVCMPSFDNADLCVIANVTT